MVIKMRKTMAGIIAGAMVTAAAVPVFAAEDKPTIYIAGDSTAQMYKASSNYPQNGWGQVFEDFFTDDIIIENRAMGGRSTKRFINDGRLDKIFEEIKPGDYLFIQFGINDGAKDKPERYTSVEDYKTLLTERYIGEAEKLGAVPVLMTPSAAANWDDEAGKFKDSRLEYGAATRELAEELGCKFIDINRIMTDAYNSMEKDEVLSGYFVCEPLESKQYPEGTDDHTHLKEKGARLIAKLIVEAIPKAVPELAPYIKGGEVFTDIAGHWAEDEIISMQESGLVKGIGDGKFAPDVSVTRAEFLKMAMEAAGIPSHAYREGECLDAAIDDWYCFYLQSALDKGLIAPEMTGGTAEAALKTVAEATEEKEAVTVDIMSYTGEFKGNTPITREEMAVIAMRCLSYAAKHSDKEIKTTAEETGIADSGITESYMNTVEAAYSYGLLIGMEDGSFHAKDNLTRAQAVTVMARIAEMLK